MTTNPAPCSATSGKLQCSEMTTGNPAANASSTALLNPSLYESVTNKSAHRYAASVRSPVNRPVNTVRSSTPAFLRIDVISPRAPSSGPATSSTVSGNIEANAAKQRASTSTPLIRCSRPRKRMTRLPASIG